MDKIAASIAKVLGEAMSEAVTAAHEVPPAISEALNAWIADQPDSKPSRPNVIKMALIDWFASRKLSQNRDATRPKINI